MEPKLIHKEEMLITGIAVKTNNKREVSDSGDIPKLWSRFYTEKISHKIIQSSSTEVLGVYTQYENKDEGDYLMLIGQQISETNRPNDDLVTVRLPASAYLVFSSKVGPVHQIVPETWKGIWKWFQEHDLERAFAGDFELYDERSENPEKAVVDVYISIKQA
ncbi:putative transcriptional regulator YdeE [Croceifilum oryzae]|uniref:Transcriptional regulator YdeE n=1 Tax=Croceifilum oryzae TaxID=1553429 RepID=A0AAJ1TDV5_9BACL|nr:GyrI-like domain-containing protein [Croceifilum oryzae]MDQ0417018.1 putative transcriptional regulator YdeE [Croceifilum oryzae]